MSSRFPGFSKSRHWISEYILFLGSCASYIGWSGFFSRFSNVILCNPNNNMRSIYDRTRNTIYKLYELYKSLLFGILSILYGQSIAPHLYGQFWKGHVGVLVTQVNQVQNQVKRKLSEHFKDISLYLVTQCWKTWWLGNRDGQIYMYFTIFINHFFEPFHFYLIIYGLLF